MQQLQSKNCFDLLNMFRCFRFSINTRYYSIKHAAKQPIKYTETINLPKTKFPNRLTAAKREEIERQLLATCFANAYNYQENHNKEPAFVLHDGPPYANGDLHMGHAVNKLLKDICLRQHLMQGQKVHYIPGWDCHGLPIELKATKGKQNEEPVIIRKKSRQFALNALERQKQEFCAWGVLANWSKEENIYLTLRPEFINKQLQLFQQFYENGLVYRDLKPVYWSPSSRTALAEAELEYDANFVSPSVYVRFALTNLSTKISNVTSKVYALVWTTTPWTLPSNQAICYNELLEYALVKLKYNEHDTNDDELYLLATNLIDDFEKNTQLRCEIVNKIQGTELYNWCYQHPINKHENSLRFFNATHVQDTKGTGLVHTAPAHGPEDFLVSLEHKIKVLSLVNEEGKYTTEAPAFLQGKIVLECGDELVLEHITNDVVHAGKMTHAYPIDWRTKQPVIIRASEQWFMNTAHLKEQALSALEDIEIYPRVNAASSKKALETQVRKRPYWCISRQRVWGTPIPVFYNKNDGKVIVNNNLIAHICSLVKKHGNIDFWWSQPIAELVPQKLLAELQLTADEIERGFDIFDIWFDSGSTWACVLGEQRIADLYLEGYDQFTGWFQSSLLTSIAARNCAPYKSLFVHGFTVDEKGHKMSKSLGNVISPKDITKKYGVDVLRWWVASHATQHMSITVSDKLLLQSAESLNKIRATLRYLKGAIGEMDSKVATTKPADASYLNKYLLSCLVDFDKEVQRAYDAYEYNRVVAILQNFVANQLSTVYIHTIKDRLYCGDEEDLAHVRYTLENCYKLLCKALWPLAPFLVEESWSFYAKNSSFYEHVIKSDDAWKQTTAETLINSAFQVKRLINQAAREQNTWTLAVELQAAGDMFKHLQMLHPNTEVDSANTELCEILQVGRIKLSECAATAGDEDDVVKVNVVPITDLILCPRCRRFALEHDHQMTCERCTHVLKMKK